MNIVESFISEPFQSWYVKVKKKFLFFTYYNYYIYYPKLSNSLKIHKEMYEDDKPKKKKKFGAIDLELKKAYEDWKKII